MSFKDWSLKHKASGDKKPGDNAIGTPPVLEPSPQPPVGPAAPISAPPASKP